MKFCIHFSLQYGLGIPNKLEPAIIAWSKGALLRRALCLFLDARIFFPNKRHKIGVVPPEEYMARRQKVRAKLYVMSAEARLFKKNFDYSTAPGIPTRRLGSFASYFIGSFSKKIKQIWLYHGLCRQTFKKSSLYIEQDNEWFCDAP